MDLDDLKQPNVLVYLCILLGAGQVADAPFIDAPAFALVFAAMFFIAARVLHSGHLTGGALFAGALSLFEVVNYPGWDKNSVGEWVFTTVFALVALLTLVMCGWSLRDRRRAKLREAPPAEA
jgi:hypothetical protein